MANGEGLLYQKPNDPMATPVYVAGIGSLLKYKFALSLSHKYYYGLQWAIDSTVLNFNFI